MCFFCITVCWTFHVMTLIKIPKLLEEKDRHTVGRNDSSDNLFFLYQLSILSGICKCLDFFLAPTSNAKNSGQRISTLFRTPPHQPMRLLILTFPLHDLSIQCRDIRIYGKRGDKERKEEIPFGRTQSACRNCSPATKIFRSFLQHPTPRSYNVQDKNPKTGS